MKRHALNWIICLFCPGMIFAEDPSSESVLILGKPGYASIAKVNVDGANPVPIGSLQDPVTFGADKDKLVTVKWNPSSRCYDFQLRTLTDGSIRKTMEFKGNLMAMAGRLEKQIIVDADRNKCYFIAFEDGSFGGGLDKMNYIVEMDFEMEMINKIPLNELYGASRLLQTSAGILVWQLSGTGIVKLNLESSKLEKILASELDGYADFLEPGQQIGCYNWYHYVEGTGVFRITSAGGVEHLLNNDLSLKKNARIYKEDRGYIGDSALGVIEGVPAILLTILDDDLERSRFGASRKIKILNAITLEEVRTISLAKPINRILGWSQSQMLFYSFSSGVTGLKISKKFDQFEAISLDYESQKINDAIIVNP